MGTPWSSLRDDPLVRAVAAWAHPYIPQDLSIVKIAGVVGCLSLTLGFGRQILRDPLLTAIAFGICGYHIYKWDTSRPNLNWKKPVANPGFAPNLYATTVEDVSESSLSYYSRADTYVHEHSTRRYQLLLAYDKPAPLLICAPPNPPSATIEDDFEELSILQSLPSPDEYGVISRGYQLRLAWSTRLLLTWRQQACICVRTPTFSRYNPCIFLPRLLKEVLFNGGQFFSRSHELLTLWEPIGVDYNLYWLFALPEHIPVEPHEEDKFGNRKPAISRLLHSRGKPQGDMTIEIPKAPYTIYGFKRQPNRIYMESAFCPVTGADRLSVESHKDFISRLIVRLVGNVLALEGHPKQTCAIRAAEALRPIKYTAHHYIDSVTPWDCEVDEYLDINQVQSMFRYGSDIFLNDVFLRMQEENWLDSKKLSTPKQLEETLASAKIANDFYMNRAIMEIKKPNWQPERDDLSHWETPHDQDYEYFDADEDGIDPLAYERSEYTEDEPDDYVNPFSEEQLNLLPQPTAEQSDETPSRLHKGSEDTLMSQKHVNRLFLWINTICAIDGERFLRLNKKYTAASGEEAVFDLGECLDQLERFRKIKEELLSVALHPIETEEKQLNHANSRVVRRKCNKPRPKDSVHDQEEQHSKQASTDTAASNNASRNTYTTGTEEPQPNGSANSFGMPTVTPSPLEQKKVRQAAKLEVSEPPAPKHFRARNVEQIVRPTAFYPFETLSPGTQQYLVYQLEQPEEYKSFVNDPLGGSGAHKVDYNVHEFYQDHEIPFGNKPSVPMGIKADKFIETVARSTKDIPTKDQKTPSCVEAMTSSERAEWDAVRPKDELLDEETEMVYRWQRLEAEEILEPKQVKFDYPRWLRENEDTEYTGFSYPAVQFDVAEIAAEEAAKHDIYRDVLSEYAKSQALNSRRAKKVTNNFRGRGAAMHDRFEFPSGVSGLRHGFQERFSGPWETAPTRW